jgi:hypothetical protein
MTIPQGRSQSHGSIDGIEFPDKRCKVGAETYPDKKNPYIRVII